MSEILVPAESDEKSFSENRGPILTIAVPTYNAVSRAAGHTQNRPGMAHTVS